jgi:predicted RNA binding protein YcfA (HicA-like mRNA interferase family)
MSLSDLKESSWNPLLGSIRNKKCLPFLGAGAAAPWLPLGKDIARKWAEEFDYPMDDRYYLPKVAQFLAIDRDDDLYPKYKLADELKRIQVPDFSLPEYSNTIYAILADLDLPFYLTTNYDHFLENALRTKGKRPLSKIYVWSEEIKKYLNNLGFESVFAKGSKYKPDSDNPLVYHVHGDMDIPVSMVLTEVDYLRFQINYQEKSVPTIVRYFLYAANKLYLGYSLEDTNIRVFLSNTFRSNISNDMIIVLPPSDFTARKDMYARYLDRYYRKLFGMKAYFGNIQLFGEELKKRLNERRNRDKNSQGPSNNIKRCTSDGKPINA